MLFRSSLSRRGHPCGGGLVMDFCSSISAASRRRPLQRRWGEGGRCAGAAADGLFGLVVCWSMALLVLGLWSAVGRSGGAPRRRRPEALDLEVEGLLGVHPRPVCQSERWASLMLLLGFLKAFRRWSFFNLWSAGFRPFFLRCSGAGVERRCCVGAVTPRGMDAILRSEERRVGKECLL